MSQMAYIKGKFEKILRPRSSFLEISYQFLRYLTIFFSEKNHLLLQAHPSLARNQWKASDKPNQGGFDWGYDPLQYNWLRFKQENCQIYRWKS